VILSRSNDYNYNNMLFNENTLENYMWFTESRTNNYMWFTEDTANTYNMMTSDKIFICHFQDKHFSVPIHAR